MSLERIPKNQIYTRNTIEQREHEDDAAARRVIPVDENGDPINEANPLPVSVTIQGESQPDEVQIFNVLAANANQEYFLVLPTNTSKFEIQARGNAKLQFCFVSAESDTNFFTVTPGNSYMVEGLKISGKTVYFRSSKANETAEFIVWTF